MYNYLLDEKLVSDFQTLFNNTNDIEKNTTIYTLFIKEKILADSNLN